DMGFQARVIEIRHGVDLIELLRPWLDASSIAYMHLADNLVGRQDAMKSEYSQFYASEGANLISGLLEYVVTGNSTQVFRDLYQKLSLAEDAFKKHVEVITTDSRTSESVRDRLKSYAEMDSRNFSNLQTNLKQALNWASFPEMCNMLDSEPEYVPELLAPRTDVYIRFPINDLKSFPGMVRAILGAIVYCVNESRDGIERLMIVDEAYQVGRLQGFELIRDTMRKRGLHLMLIFQSTGLLEQAYGKESVRAWNNSVAARVFAGTDDVDDQAVISRMIGEYTVDVENRSTSTGMRGFGIGTPNDNRTKSINRQRASLMRPEQVRKLEKDAVLIFYKGEDPLICGKALSFRRDEWQHVTPFKPDKAKKKSYDGRKRAGDGKQHAKQNRSGNRGVLTKAATPKGPNPRPRAKP
ncbi:MAG: TraM recognition domain-containing protein, partial [Chloroflexi bacterium]|nr:TraM recognition domain-containing protein [Chloroflexota bacterium]